MDYNRIYNAIIDRARTQIYEGYTERHHIIPRCMGGSDAASNIVRLTAREHFVVHQLLAKIYPENRGINLALHLMSKGAGGNRLCNRQYEWTRRRTSEAISKMNTGRKASKEARDKMSESRKGKSTWNKGIPASRESNVKRSATLKERYTKQTHHLQGKPSPHLGKKHGPNPKLRGPKEIFVCEHCNKNIGGVSNYYRWHHNNCKLKK